LEKAVVIQYPYRTLFWLETANMTALALQALISSLKKIADVAVLVTFCFQNLGMVTIL